MSKFSFWDSGHKGKTYKFIDGAQSQYIRIGGTAVYIHLYIGPYQQKEAMLNRDGTTIPAFDPSDPPPPDTSGNVSTIQDVLFLENRDRKYSDNVFELRGLYNINDMDYDLRQFGLFLSNDTLFIEFHLNDMIASLGRKLMSGDVLELPHRRDDTLDQNDPAINKFYVVTEGSRSASGYGPNWWPFVWRVKVEPMTASQEFNDILKQKQTNPYGWTDPNGSIGELMSTLGVNMGIDEAVVADAKASVPRRYFQTEQFWMIVPEVNEKSNSYPWVFAGDGTPPNGAVPLGAGHAFPSNPQEGDYYLRNDYSPATLFMWLQGAWRFQEQDWRQSDWSAAHRLLLSFINDNNTSTFQDGTTAPEKIALSQAVKPRADF